MEFLFFFILLIVSVFLFLKSL